MAGGKRHRCGQWPSTRAQERSARRAGPLERLRPRTPRRRRSANGCMKLTEAPSAGDRDEDLGQRLDMAGGDQTSVSISTARSTDSAPRHGDEVGDRLVASRWRRWCRRVGRTPGSRRPKRLADATFFDHQLPAMTQTTWRMRAVGRRRQPNPRARRQLDRGELERMVGAAGTADGGGSPSPGLPERLVGRAQRGPAESSARTSGPASVRSKAAARRGGVPGRRAGLAALDLADCRLRSRPTARQGRRGSSRAPRLQLQPIGDLRFRLSSITDVHPL